jgi:hypothetical protein
LVCDPRKNALLKVGNKSDRMDSRKLAELLALESSPVGLSRTDGRTNHKRAGAHRAEWLAKITEAGVRRRAELYY